MNNKIGMNTFLYSLLVTKQMNNFTVIEAKNTLMDEHSKFNDSVEARKFIYRQLTRHIDKGLIKRTDFSDTNGKKVVYSKTTKFFESTFTPISRDVKLRKKITKNRPKSIIEKTEYKVELNKELLGYEIDLNTVLEEAKEYKRLLDRFPELQDQLQVHQSQAKEKSIKLLGKVHALQNILNYNTTEHLPC